MKTLRVLVADDSDSFRRVLCEYLNKLGPITVVAEAVNGHHAIELCQKTLPDIVFMDISMPSFSGLEAARIIKQKFPLIMVIVVTLHDADHYRSLAKQYLVDAFVAKNSMKDDLACLIRNRQLAFGQDA